MAEGRQRIDKWLWFARIVKTRAVAAALVTGGHVRVNRQKVVKPSHDIGPDDVVTATVAGRVRVLRVLGCAVRRGPATDAQALYEDLSGAQPGHAAPQKGAAEP